MKHEKDIVNEYDIPGSSLSTVLKNKDKISKIVEKAYCKTSSFPEIKQTMVKWMKRWDYNLFILRPLIQKKSCSIQRIYVLYFLQG